MSYNVLQQIIKFIEDNDIYSYRQVFLYACNHCTGWLDYLCADGSVIVQDYLQARIWEDGVIGGSQRAHSGSELNNIDHHDSA